MLQGSDYKVFIYLQKIKRRRGIEEKGNDLMREQILTRASKKKKKKKRGDGAEWDSG